MLSMKTTETFDDLLLWKKVLVFHAFDEFETCYCYTLLVKFSVSDVSVLSIILFEFYVSFSFFGINVISKSNL